MWNSCKRVAPVCPPPHPPPDPQKARLVAEGKAHQRKSSAGGIAQLGTASLFLPVRINTAPNMW